MGLDLKRVEQDRAIFERGVRDQLHAVLSQGNYQIVAKALERAIRTQIITEEIAREQGVELDERAIRKYEDEHRSLVNEQVDRAITNFICSVVSQEG